MYSYICQSRSFILIYIDKIFEYLLINLIIPADFGYLIVIIMDKELWLYEDLYVLAATGDDGQALLISNVSEKKDRKLKIDAGDYTVDKCMTVNENCEWVEIVLPEKIEIGSILYITFKK